MICARFASLASTRRVGIAALIAGAPLLLAGCKEENKYAAPPPAKVTVAKPTQAPVTLYAEFTGNTSPVASVDLEARVQGFIESIDYLDGEAVKKDRELFKIEKAQYQAQVDLQQAQLDGAKAKQANAQREADRQSILGQKDVASQRNVDDAQTNLAAANAQVAAAQASLALAKTSLGYTTVTAPFDGVVTRRLVNVGTLVGSAGPTKLATILQVDPLYVYFNITEQQQINLRDALAKRGKTLKDMREERLEMPIQVALSSDTSFQYAGKVDYIAPQVDPSTGTLQLRGTLPNKDVALVPGLFVRVRVAVGKLDDALLINDTAVMSNQTGSYVMVVGAGDVVEQRQVTLGPQEGQLRVITKGLKADDRVVIGAIQRAIAGNTVAPVAGAMAAAPTAPTPAPAALNPGAESGTAKP
ncbi:MexE family multidrug efflux RND transporter periplasmic adaptor subunit [Rhodopseudomonas palustris]|uniref:efflux RND transporter periplasmic adaptor subunit n=1 Tax=Rhodopseudomonas palustris TaxID=1076 RepID=UPI000D1B22DE|nr:efflux RND transporter periplasmic adaptor subunit [Rhodopseudomonas palustris]AVT77066.1 MexE family multidrug efflux RND transporter periplasmic adaptor subunit [Rhodopseudomonas palustris]